MSTTTEATELFVEFRCSRCYQVRHEPAQNMGQELPCMFCGHQQIAPQVDFEELKNADQVVQAMGHVTAQQGQFSRDPMTRDEIHQVAKDRAVERNANAVDNSGIGTHADASIRLFAVLLDSVITVCAAMLSFGVGFALASAGICPGIEDVQHADPLSSTTIEFLVCHLGLFGMYNVLIWVLIARLGQSPGKMLFGIKIVDSLGNPPGFVSGVILRYIVAGFLFNLIPLGQLINSLWILFGTPPRCGHDHIAGTYVVNT